MLNKWVKVVGKKTTNQEWRAQKHLLKVVKHLRFFGYSESREDNVSNLSLTFKLLMFFASLEWKKMDQISKKKNTKDHKTSLKSCKTSQFFVYFESREDNASNLWWKNNASLFSLHLKKAQTADTCIKRE